MLENTRGGVPVSDQQAAVVDHVIAKPVTVVSAGAGSGKTHTTVATVLELLQKHDAKLNQFVLITFTNEAADQLRSSIESKIRERTEKSTDNVERRLWLEQQERLSVAYIGTIHSFCRWIIRTFGYEEQVAREADVSFVKSILGDAVQQAIEDYVSVSDPLLLSSSLDWQPYQLHAFTRKIIEYMQNRGVSPVNLTVSTTGIPDPYNDFREHIVQIVRNALKKYAQIKQESHRLDSSDLLGKAADILVGSESSRIKIQIAKRYQYLFVDEFQDTDVTQKRIIDALKGSLKRVLVVGDSKQSIYRFRGADVSLLNQIADENNTKPKELSISRRPTADLLRAQTALFRSIGKTYPAFNSLLEANPVSLYKGTSFKPFVYCSAGSLKTSQSVRIEQTAKIIRWLLTQQIERIDSATNMPVYQPVKPGDIVILTRSNPVLATYEQELKQLLQTDGILVRSETAGSFFEQPEIISTYHMLRLLLLYPDETSLVLALRTPYLRAMDSTEREQFILQYHTQNGNPLVDWLEDKHPLKKNVLAELRTSVRTDTVPQILSRLYNSFEIEEYYQRQGDQQAVNNLQKLREIARRLFQEEQALSLRQFVDWLRIQIETLQEESEGTANLVEQEQAPPYIRIMTVHKAKGLEFPIVILPEIQTRLFRETQAPDFRIFKEGLDVLLPMSNGQDTRIKLLASKWNEDKLAHVHEEMRIFYVAVTRAQCAVVVIGSGHEKLNTSKDKYYSWQDEVLKAEAELTRDPGIALFVKK